MAIGGALVKGMIGGALKERAKNIGKTKAGKLLAREGRVMMGKPQPKAEVQAVQPQQTLAPAASVVSSGGGGGPSKFRTEKEAALHIKTTTLQVATLLKGSYVLEKEQLKNKRQASEQAKRGKAEKSLEKGPKGGGGKVKMPKLPGKGLLDKIFGFVSTIVFGWLALKLVDWLPALGKILPTLGRVADWFISAGIWVVDALAGIIDFGYKLVDKMEGWVKNVFGEEGAEKFKTFMTNLKDLISGFLVWKIIGQNIFKSVVKNIKFAFGIAKSIVANAWKVVNFITRGAAGRLAGAAGRGLSRLGRGLSVGARRLIGRGGRGFFKGASKGVSSLMKKGAGGLLKRGALKVFGKTFVKAAGKIFGKVPIIGPLIVGIVSLVSGEPLGQALFKTFGAAIGGLLGTFIPIPIVGTLLGEAIGVFVGDLLYHLIIKKDPKAAMKMLRDTIMGIFKAGQFIFNFVKTGVTNVIDNFPTIPIPDFRPGDIIAAIMQKVGLGGVLGIKVWNPFGDDFSILNMLKSLPGLQEVMGFFAKFIPGMGRYIENGKLLAIPNLAMLTPLGLPFLTPLIAKSFLPGIFGAPTPPTGLAKAPSPPPEITTDSVKAEEERIRKEKRKEMIEGMKKTVGNVTGAVTGAAGKAWNWITGGGGDGDKKGKVIKEALKKKNAAEKGSSKRYSQEEYDKMTADYKANPTSGGAMQLNRYARGLKAQNQAEFGGTGEAFTFGDKTYQPGEEGYLEAINTAKSIMHGDQLSKLKTANQQGGAKAVIESISTTASYEETGKEVVTVPATTSSSPSDTPTTKKNVLIMNSGGGSDPYEGLYKGS